MQAKQTLGFSGKWRERVLPQTRGPSTELSQAESDLWPGGQDAGGERHWGHCAHGPQGRRLGSLGWGFGLGLKRGQIQPPNLTS